MLNHLLAGTVALGSLVLFLSGFFFPEVQRKPDLAWSGVALLYALLLFAEGDRTSGGALLGHIASVALILWFGWQTLQQRRQFSPSEHQTAIPGSLETLMPFLKDGWGRLVVTYGETAAWVQDQLGKEDASTLPEMQTPLSPQQDVSDEDWENSNAASSSPSDASSLETSASSPIENIEQDVIEVLSPSPSEDPVTTTSVAEPPASQADISLDHVQDTPVATAPTPTEPEEIQSTLTAPEGPTVEKTVEVSHDNSIKENIGEPVSVRESEQVSNTEAVEESVHTVTREEEDESWPPEDSIT
jgi:Ycf66 protein N-terminus